MSTKIFSLDPKRISAALLKDATVTEQVVSHPVTVRSTIFSLGSDARIGSLQISTPDLFLIELMKDQLKQLFVRVHWNIPRFDIDSKKIIGFNVYRKSIRTVSNRKLSPNQIAKLLPNLKSNGSFSEEKKGINNVDRGLINLAVLNPNLSERARTIAAQQLSSLTPEPRTSRSQIENFVRTFEKIAFVDYSQFIKNEQMKTVFVTDTTNVSMFFDDKTVGFGEKFEYYVSSVSANFDETYQSDVVRVLVMDNSGISMPDLFAKQIDATSNLIQIWYKSKEQIDNVFLYRREEDSDVAFTKIASFFDVQKDTVEFLDKKSFFGKQYIYRAFTENVHGVISPVSELSVFSSVNVEKSHSNSLKKPVFHAMQQKNVATLTISLNDPKVLFFRIDRRDLTSNERAFTTPGRDTDGYGGTGWITNQLFYGAASFKNRPALSLKTSADSTLFRAPLTPPDPVQSFQRNGSSPPAINNTISFIDNAVLSDHIYQYRIVGVDKFGNTTSSAYQTIEILNQDLLKSPINLQIFVLREFPMRIKLKWTDENIYENGVVPLYEVQRRTGHNSFASFPMTENNFIIDEVYSDDFISFSINKIEDLFDRLVPNKVSFVSTGERSAVPPPVSISSGERAPLPPAPLLMSTSERPAKKTSRASGVLDFLKENFFYFYRVKVITALGSFSPFSEEVKAVIVQPLSLPNNFSALNENPKVKPTVVQLSWDVDADKLRPDHFEIERKIDNVNDFFHPIAKVYFENTFFDRSLVFGKNYIYRIRSVDNLGHSSAFVETRIGI